MSKIRELKQLHAITYNAFIQIERKSREIITILIIQSYNTDLAT